MSTTGWRICSPKYATTPSDMLSGKGAYLHGGRWNSKGSHVVYLGSSIAQASMELLVHLGRSDILKGYCLLAVTFDDDLIEHISLEDLPWDWSSLEMTSSVQATGDNWVEAGSSLILQVPSAAIQGESNYLLNPNHPDVENVKVGGITPFDYDARLQK